MTRHVILMGAVRKGAGKLDLPQAYYVGHDGVNKYIYGRGPKERALWYSGPDALAFVAKARALGYPCRPVPAVPA